MAELEAHKYRARTSIATSANIRGVKFGLSDSCEVGGCLNEVEVEGKSMSRVCLRALRLSGLLQPQTMKSS